MDLTPNALILPSEVMVDGQDEAPPQALYLSTSESSGNDSVDALVSSLSSTWGTSGLAGTSASITYTFLTEEPSYHSGGMQELTDTAKEQARVALAKWAAVTNLTFTEVSSGGTIAFGMDLQTGSSGYAYLPSETFEQGGDVWLDYSSSTNLSPTPGTFGFETLLHEIGHALGLKHPGNYDASGGGTDAPYLSSSDDNTDNTIMSYNEGASGTVSEIGPFDILSIQYLYGLTTSGTVGNLTFGSDAAEAYSGGSGVQFFHTESGNDTVDLGAGDDGAVAGYGSDTVFGGAGNDYIFGNHNSDLLSGGDGDDTIYGGQNDGTPRTDAYGNLRMQDGVETIVGGAGNDLLVGNYGNETMEGGTGNDTIYGGQNDDTILGQDGNDYLYGNRDNDTLSGGVGNDDLDGGSGTDVFVFADGELSNGSYDVIRDFSQSEGDQIDLSGIDANTGSSGDQAFLFGIYNNGVQLFDNTDYVTLTLDVDGDSSYDHLIYVYGDTSLTASDFVL